MDELQKYLNNRENNGRVTKNIRIIAKLMEELRK